MDLHLRLDLSWLLAKLEVLSESPLPTLSRPYVSTFSQNPEAANADYGRILVTLLGHSGPRSS